MFELLHQEITLGFGTTAVRRVPGDNANAVTKRKQSIRHPTTAKDYRLGFGTDRLPTCHDLMKELTQSGMTCTRECFPKFAPKHILRRTLEVPRSFIVEKYDAPVAIYRIKALSDTIKN
jgi:hypothetical protein